MADRPRRRGRGLQRRQRHGRPHRGRGAAAAQRPQGRRRHERARDGLRQARPRLRRALPGARLRDRLLPAGRPRRRARSSAPRSCCCAAREDRRIQDFFIEQAFPRRELVDRVLERIGDAGEDGASTQALMAEVNLGKGRVEAMLKVLDVEGAVARDGSRWLAQPGSGWQLRRRALRAHHRAAPPRAGGDGAARRRRALPDARAAGGARRPRAGGLRALLGLRRPALRRAARPRARARGVAAPALAPARARGQEDGARRRGRDAQDPRRRARRGGPRARAARRRRLGPARAARAAAPGASTTSSSRPPPRSCAAGASPVKWVAAIPSQRSGELVPGFARALAERLGLAYAPVLERVADGPPQREMANSHQQVANVRGRFAVTAAPPAGRRPARRRHPLQRLDARDGRRPAARQGRRRRSTRSR